jgi:hypothetical protein
LRGYKEQREDELVFNVAFFALPKNYKNDLNYTIGMHML